MRLRVGSLAAFFILGSLALPLAAHAGGIPFFGPIIPQTGEIATCPGNWSLLLTVVNNIMSFLLTMAIVFLAPIMIAVAGFQYVTSAGNPGGISKAHTMLTGTVVGIVVALAAWIMVDAIMAVLYNPSTVGSTWTSLIKGGGPVCVPVASVLHQSVPGANVTGTDDSGNAILTFGDGACDPAQLKAIIPGLTTAEANTFACIAKPESACGKRGKNYSWNVPNKQGLASTAYGAFQVLLSSNSAYFNSTVCQQAAGVTTSINCRAGFGANGFTAGGDPVALETCLKAASNLSCNFSAAYKLYMSSGGGRKGYAHWTADGSHVAQQACIDQHSGL